MTDESSLIEEPFQIVSVRRVDPPADTQGSNWYCYEIEQGKNMIRGYRQGSLRSVTDAVEEIVVQLNERRVGKRGRVHLTTPTWKKKGDK